MISVVISNYNGAPFLEEALQSVLDQRYDDYEVITVDDGSTDDSRQLIRDFNHRAGSRFRLIEHERNLGQAEGFNTGIRAARGRVICFLDSDDFWFPDKLQAVHDAFESEPHMALFQHNMWLYRDEALTNERFRNFLVTGDGVAYAMKTGLLVSFAPTAGLAVLREAAMKVLPIPSTFRLSADGYLTRTVMCHGLINATHRCLGAYRVHEQNGTFENDAYDMDVYLNQQLFPALNRYYASIDCPLRYGQPSRRRNGAMSASLVTGPTDTIDGRARLPQRLKDWLRKAVRGNDSMSR
jgi:glycosyltransferase involved in cell wall biosynthesis